MSRNNIKRTVYFSILTLYFAQMTVYFQRKTEYFSLEQCDAIRVGVHLAAILYIESLIPDITRVKIHLQFIMWVVQKTVHFTLGPTKDSSLYTTLGRTVHNSSKSRSLQSLKFRPSTFTPTLSFQLINVFLSLLCFQVNYNRNTTYNAIGKKSRRAFLSGIWRCNSV